MPSTNVLHLHQFSPLDYSHAFHHAIRTRNHPLPNPIFNKITEPIDPYLADFFHPLLLISSHFVHYLREFYSVYLFVDLELFYELVRLQTVIVCVLTLL